MSKVNKIFNLVDVYSEEKKEGMGEDYFSYSHPDKCRNDCVYTAVFDGCGGIGAKRYETDINVFTGAFLASRACAYKTFEFYNNQSFYFDKRDSMELKLEYTDVLKDLKNKYAIEQSKLGGSLAGKSFPTTASIVSVKYENRILISEFLWAGDSRGYILDEKGLKQITEDDLYGNEDALSNISSDARLSNVINSDTDFELHSRIVTQSSPTLYISATDGCFGYLPTPMHFEYVILNAICISDSINEFESRIRNVFRNAAGDDFTIGVIAAGFESYNSMRMYFRKRERYMYENYIKYLANSRREDIKNTLWEEYKKDYYKFYID